MNLYTKGKQYIDFMINQWLQSQKNRTSKKHEPLINQKG